MIQQVLVLQWICIVCLMVGCHLVTAKRGPHHPKSEKRRHMVDDHLVHEAEHMQQDLEEFAVENNKNVDNMTEEEKSFYYFKIHDSDNNDFLDGLEMLHAATHRGSGHFHKVDRINQLEKFEDELIHIVEVIDDFIEFADLNNDGYLNYPEYMKAIALSEANKKNNNLEEIAKTDDHRHETHDHEVEEEEEEEEEEREEEDHEADNEVNANHIDDL